MANHAEQAREMLEELKKWRDRPMSAIAGKNAEIARLTAEVERLRGILEHIWDWDYDTMGSSIADVRGFVRAALAGKVTP